MAPKPPTAPVTPATYIALEHLISYHDKSVIQYPSGAISPHERTATPEELIVDHLSGHRRLGAYCPNTEGLTTFAVIDIDTGDDHALGVDDPEEELAAWLDVLGKNDLQYYACHSRSGLGYHIWVLFERPVPARDVRHMIHDLREKRQGVDIFPKQNIAKKKGYGNFVWMPMFNGTPDFEIGTLDHRNPPPPEVKGAPTPTPTPTPKVSTSSGRFSGTATVGGRPIPPLSPIVEIMLLYIDSSEYHQWFKVLLALCNTYGDGAKETAREWSKYSDNYEHHAFEEKWAECLREKEEDEIEIQVNSIIHLAKQEPNPWDGSEWDQWCEQYYENLVTLRGARAIDQSTQTVLPVPDTASDYDIVRAIEEYLDDQQILVIGAEDKLWQYNETLGVWEHLTDREIIWRFIDPYNGTFAQPYTTANGQTKYPPIKMTGTLMRNILALLYERSYTVDQPFPEPRTGVAFRNGFLTDEGELIPHSPDHYSRDLKNFDFDPEVTNPFFEDWLLGAVEDHNGYLAIQEFVGTCLMGEATKYQRALLLYGPGATGKSIMLKLMQQFFGDSKTCSVPPQDFNQEHSRARMAGKKLNIVEELPNRAFTDTSNLKSLVTGGLIEAREKYGKQFSFENRAGIAISANILPVTSSTEDGIWRRILMVSMPYVVAKEDRVLSFEKKLAAGYHPSWFAAWALKGYLRVKEQGRYTESEVGHEYLEEWQEHSDPVKEFVGEHLLHAENSDEAFLSNRDLYSHYKRWCRETGNIPLTKRRLISRVENLGYEKARKSNTRGVVAKLIDLER